MFATRVYYNVKPYIPRRLRMAVRRLTAQGTLARSRTTWPIHDPAGSRPAGWPGWPDGAGFALVLTHDVEGPAGFAKCERLAALERTLGFRSSFNLVPEGQYHVSPEFRSRLGDDGFEIGVHDLRHDGKLFQSRREFLNRAARINGYLRNWGAVGFRSAFMLRRLEWLHDLEIEYDSSTFDTDPFEFQPDGVGTIFPFWIQARSWNAGATVNGADGAKPGAMRRRDGYLEIPYTLPQDSTLYLVLREGSPRIWIEKLDWVARHGGMALVNVHPDYMGFNGSLTRDEYPAAFYTEFLQHVRGHYRGQYWNATPREIAVWCGKTGLAATDAPADSAHPNGSASLNGASTALAGKHAGVLLYSTYPCDPRPRRAAEAMTDAGMTVNVLSLARDDRPEPRREIVNGVAIKRLQWSHRRTSGAAYVWQYARFFVTSLWHLTRNEIRRHHDVVHVHNMPDFLVFAAIVPKLRGARIILDLHDPMPELMMSIYRLSADDWRVRLLRWLERRSIRFADLAITPNKSFRDLFVSRSCEPGKIAIVMNSPEDSIFDRARFAGSPEPGHNGNGFSVMHHGSILHRHGVDVLVEAIARLRPDVPGLRLDLYGYPSEFLDQVLAVAKERGVSELVRYHGPKTQAEIAEAIRACDVGVVPNRLSPFTAINFPTRLFEYLSLGRPVIAPRTQGIADYFGDDEIITFEPGSVDALADRIRWVHDHRSEAQAYAVRGAAVHRRHRWASEKRRFVEALDSLVSA